MPTIKDIKSIAKERNIEFPKKIRKAEMVHILQKKKETIHAMHNIVVQIMNVYGLKIVKKNIRKRAKNDVFLALFLIIYNVKRYCVCFDCVYNIV